QHRLDKIDHRLEVLEGFITAFLNLDRVIDIIRYDDDPKPALMREDWSKDHARALSEADYKTPAPGDGELTEVQVDAILNMRLRSLRRLEELELRREFEELTEERADLEDLLENEGRQWKLIADQLRDVKKTFGDARRTDFAEAVEIEDVPLEAMIDREPITVVCSQMGWIRAMTGHIDLARELKFKDGDGPRHI
ncbi:MAG: DNA gyrase subunit A, partial [Pseudomonadota bacterium]